MRRASDHRDRVASPHDGAEEPRTWCRDIEVRYCQDAWQVRGERLGNDLVFRELIDAERLAVALGRRRSCDVAIYDRNDRLATRHATGWPQLGHRLAGAGIANEG